jgi:hypothetical protein
VWSDLRFIVKAVNFLLILLISTASFSGIALQTFAERLCQFQTLLIFSQIGDGIYVTINISYITTDNGLQVHIVGHHLRWLLPIQKSSNKFISVFCQFVDICYSKKHTPVLFHMPYTQFTSSRTKMHKSRLSFVYHPKPMFWHFSFILFSNDKCDFWIGNKKKIGCRPSSKRNCSEYLFRIYPQLILAYCHPSQETFSSLSMPLYAYKTLGLSMILLINCNMKWCSTNTFTISILNNYSN